MGGECKPQTQHFGEKFRFVLYMCYAGLKTCGSENLASCTIMVRRLFLPGQCRQDFSFSVSRILRLWQKKRVEREAWDWLGIVLQLSTLSQSLHNTVRLGVLHGVLTQKKVASVKILSESQVQAKR